jgi:hypothetical protein
MTTLLLATAASSSAGLACVHATPRHFTPETLQFVAPAWHAGITPATVQSMVPATTL